MQLQLQLVTHIVRRTVVQINNLVERNEKNLNLKCFIF